MDFELSERQKDVRQLAREFARTELAPSAARLDETGEFPWESLKRAAGLGLMGLPIPEEYGGAGADTVSFALAVEEMGKVCASTALTIAAHTALVAYPILRFGDAEQKRRFLPHLARGELLGAFALTEPDAGSDAGATRTHAIRQGDEWVVAGRKMFITSGNTAGLILITARTEPGEGTAGISMLLVGSDTPGFRAGPPLAKMGLHGSATAELFFEDCHIPLANLLGTPGKGFRQALTALDGGRIGIGALSVGLAQGALDYALAYAQNRTQFGRPIADLQAIQFKLADMATGIEAARLLVLRAAYLKDHERPFSAQASMAKLFASETGERVCHEALQILGGYGYLRDHPVERMYRDIRLMEIGEGTSEVQRLVIARNLLRGLGSL